MNSNKATVSYSEIAYILVSILAVLTTIIGVITIFYFVLLVQYEESNNYGGLALSLGLFWLAGALFFRVYDGMEFEYSDEYERWLKLPEPFASLIMTLIVPLAMFLAIGSIASSEGDEIKVRATNDGIALIEGHILHNPLKHDVQMAYAGKRTAYGSIPVTFGNNARSSIEIELNYELKHHPMTYQLIYEGGERRVLEALRSDLESAIKATVSDYTDLHKVTRDGFTSDLAARLQKRALPWVERGEISVTDIPWIVDRKL